MTTVYNEGVWRVEVAASKPTAGTQVSPVVMLPDGVTDITVYVKGSTTDACSVTESPSSGVAIQTGTPAAEWVAVDASLTNVDATTVRYLLNHTPVALKLTVLVNDATATMVVTGRRVR
jgi:hypothetical protein